jgi:HEPN domain-containing protein
MNPQDNKRVLSIPEDWLRHAESDLGLARLGQANKNILRSQICFHTQQAAEKSIKAVLLFRHIDFPLIHDIEELLEICEQGHVEIPSDIFDAASLTPYAVETRYPGRWEEITGSEVEEAIKLAETVVKWAKEYVKS